MNIELQEILTQMVSFAILWFLLKKFAWDKILKVLDERKDKIQDSFDKIEQKTNDIDVLKADYETKLKDIEATARQKINEAIADGQKAAAQLQEKARLDAKKTMEKAKANIVLEIAKAKVELRDEVVKLAIGAAEKIITKEIDDKKHNALVLDFIEAVDKKEDSK